MLEKLTDKFNIKQRVDLKVSTLCNIPFAYGLFKPVIMLPSKMKNWQGQRLEAVLQHELAHINRKDCLTQFNARVVQHVGQEKHYLGENQEYS